jgi:CDP-diacylglycerol--glycerol-3-phosphate 3-phosphatidyltransferase
MLNNAEARGVVAPVVEPIARALLRIGLSADMVTIIGAVIAVTTALYFIPRDEFLPAIIILLLFLAGDVIDGTMARLSGTQGPYGAWLDATMDRIADVAVYGAILWWSVKYDLGTPTTILAWIVLAGSVAISYAKARAEAVGANADGGLAERAERLIVVGIGGLLYVFGLDWAMTAALAVLSVGVVITVIQRAVKVRGQLKPQSGAAGTSPMTDTQA